MSGCRFFTLNKKTYFSIKLLKCRNLAIFVRLIKQGVVLVGQQVGRFYAPQSIGSAFLFYCLRICLQIKGAIIRLSIYFFIKINQSPSN